MNPVNTSIADLYAMFPLVKCLFQHSVQDALVASGDKFSKLVVPASLRVLWFNIFLSYDFIAVLFYKIPKFFL